MQNTYFLPTFQMQKFFLIFSIFLIACQKEIKLPPPNIPQKVVVNCLFSPAKPWSVFLSLSADADNAVPPLVENATVTILKEGLFWETLSYKAKGEYVGGSVPEANHYYSIEVKVPDFDLITATDSVPSAVKIIDAFFTARKATNTANNPLFQQTVIFKDPLEQQNYYQLYGAMDYYFVTDVWGVFYPFANTASHCMNDEVINGQTISFATTTTVKDRPAGNPSIGDSTLGVRRIRLHSLSPTHFKFLKTGRIQAINNFTPTSETWTSILSVTEPQNIYSNIQGGLGIFAAYNSDTMVTRYIK